MPIAPGQAHTVVVRARPVAAGMHRDILSLSFGGFSIGRYIEARCGDAALLDMLKPASPFVRQPKRRPPPPRHLLDVVSAPPLPSAGASQPPRMGPKLETYALHNSSWVSTLEQRRGEAEHLMLTGMEQMHELRAGVTDREAQKAYARQQSNLLYTEEVQLMVDLRSFDFEGDKASVLTRRAGLLWLKVPGLAEKRPSVLKGDKVQVKPAGAEVATRRFEGVAERIEAEEVGLLFSPAFASSYVSGQRVDVHFVLGRTPIRLFHQGLAQTNGLRMPILFPERSDLFDGQVEARNPTGARGLAHSIPPLCLALCPASLCRIRARVPTRQARLRPSRTPYPTTRLSTTSSAAPS